MINIDLINNRLAVTLDPHNPYYERVFVIVEYLLSSYQFDKNSWYLDYDDLGFLRKKLDMLGLVKGRTISDKALNRINWIHESHVRNEEIKQGKYNENILKSLEGKLKVNLYEDQIPAVGVLANNRRWGLFDAMGSGKTICSIASIVIRPEIKKSLVICPKNVLFGFEREILNSTYLIPIVVPAGRAKALEFIRGNKATKWDVMLIHPENLITSKRRVAYSDIYYLIERMTWDMIIVDEFHMYKNIETKRARCVSGLLKNVRDHAGERPRAIAITGTPISESPMNAYVLLDTFGRSITPNIMSFENYYCIKELKEVVDRSKPLLPNGKPAKRKFLDIAGFKNLHELKTRIERISIRRDKSDMKGFPDQVFITRDIYLRGKQKALYKAIVTEIMEDLPKSSAINIYSFLTNNTKTLRLKQLLNHPAILGEEGESAKYEEVDRVLEEVFKDPTQKAIIWTEYRKAVDLLTERYKHQYGAMKLYGGVDVDASFVDKFENDPSCRVVVSIPAKAGVGTDFLARARTAIYVDRPCAYVLYNQSLDRIHRRVKSGNLTENDRIRSQPATIIFLDVENSVDFLVRDKLMRKGEMVDALMVPNQKLLEMGRKDLLKYLK